MNKYENGKIYGVRCKTTGEVYVGSTILTLHRRLKKHETEIVSLTRGTRKSICSVKSIIDRKNYEIYLIEAFPCGSKDELHKREAYFQTNMPCINKVRAYVEYNAGYWKEFYQKHKEYNKNYAAEHREELRHYHKQKSLEFYEQNKEEVECECGWRGIKYSLKRHQRISLQHKNWLEERNL